MTTQTKIPIIPVVIIAVTAIASLSCTAVNNIQSIPVVDPLHREQVQHKIHSINFSEDGALLYVVAQHHKGMYESEYFIKKYDRALSAVEEGAILKLKNNLIPRSLAFVGDEISYLRKAWKMYGDSHPEYWVHSLSSGLHTRIEIKGIDTNFEVYAISPNNRFISTLSKTGMLNIWDLQRNKQILSTSIKTNFSARDFSATLTFSTNSHTLFISSLASSQLVEVDILTGRQKYIDIFNSSTVRAVALSNNGNGMALASEANDIVTINSGELAIHDFVGNTNRSDYLQFTNSGRCIVAADENGLVTVWSYRDLQALVKIPANVGWVTSMALSQDNSFGVSSGPKNKLVKWSLPVECR